MGRIATTSRVLRSTASESVRDSNQAFSVDIIVDKEIANTGREVFSTSIGNDCCVVCVRLDGIKFCSEPVTALKYSDYAILCNFIT